MLDSILCGFYMHVPDEVYKLLSHNPSVTVSKAIQVFRKDIRLDKVDRSHLGTLPFVAPAMREKRQNWGVSVT